MSKQATYDLFISYANDDANWVEGSLMPALGLSEEWIITKESFRFGVDSVAEFERAVSESRYTLLVLSPAFLADMWGMYSESIASYARVKDERDRLLPLLLKPCQIPPRIDALKLSFDCTDKSSQDTNITRLRELFKQPEPSLKPLPCPYPGMRPFTEADSQYFFGRDRDVKELIEHLRSYPLVTVIGPSGTGKSSLVFAGLFPALHRGELFETREWRVCDMRPGENPLTELKKTLGSELTNPEMAVKTALAQQPDAQRLLLVIDQFEEVFALSGQETTSFQETLQHLADVPNCCVVLTVRADFYPDVMTSPLWKQLQRHRKEVVPLDKDGLRDAILKPAEQVGVFVETALVERLVADAADEPGVLPLVQETLALLWGGLKRRFLPLTAYEDLSRSENAQLTGLQVAIACHADTVLAELRDEQQTIARRIFLRLIQFGEGRPDTRRQQTVRVLRSANEDQKEFDHTLEHLTIHRLLTQSGTEEDEESQVDIAHDALIDGWPTLQNWIKERRKAEQTRRQLDAKAAEWERLDWEAGLLDEVELREAEEWLGSSDAAVLGYSKNLPELVKVSQQAIENELENARETARRLRKRFIFATVFALVAILAAIGAYYGFRQATQNERIAQQETIDALNQTSKALFLAHDELGALFAGVKAGKLSIQPNVNVPTLLKYQTIFNLRDFVYNIREKNRLEDHENRFNGMRFSPDRSVLALKSADGAVKLWNVLDGTVINLEGYGVYSMNFNANGTLLALGCTDGTIKIWDISDNGLIMILRGHSASVSGINFSPDDKILVSGSNDESIKLWNVKNGEEITTLPLPDTMGNAVNVTFSPDAKFLAFSAIDSGNLIALFSVKNSQENITLVKEQVNWWGRFTVSMFSHNGMVFASPGNGYETHTITLSSVNNREGSMTLSGHSDDVISLSFSLDGKILSSGSKDNTIKLWDVKNGKEITTLFGHSDDVISLSFSPDGKILASGSKDTTIKLWNVADGQVIKTLGHSSWVDSVMFNTDGTLLASKSVDDTVKLWTVADGNRSKTFYNSDNVTNLIFSPNNALLVSIGSGHVKLWDTTNGRIVKTFSDSLILNIPVAFSPDGMLLAVGRKDGAIGLWSMKDGCEIKRFTGLRGTSSIAFSPNGTMLITGDQNGNITFLNVKDGNKINTFNAYDVELSQEEMILAAFGMTDIKGVYPNNVFNAIFSPDGMLFASRGADDTVKLWEVKDDRKIRTIKLWNMNDGSETNIFRTDSPHEVTRISFSPDGTMLALGKSSGPIELWSVKDAINKVKTFKGHFGLNSISFSPDGTMLASAGEKTIKFWNIADGSEITTLVHTPPASGISINFSSDGKMFVSGGSLGDGTIELWDLDLDALLAHGCEWLHGYLGNNPNVSEEDRSLCSDEPIVTFRQEREDAWNDLGIALEKQGQLDEALAAFQKQVMIDPDHQDAWYSMGSVLEKQNRLDEAITAFQNQLEVNPGHLFTLMKMRDIGRDFVSQGKLDEALAIYQKLLEAKSNDRNAWYNIGDVWYMQGKFGKAIAAFQRQVEIMPEHWNAWNYLGNTFDKQDKLEEAIIAYQKQIEVKHDHEWAWYNIGNIRYKQDKFDEAIAAFQKQVEVKPDHENAWNYLGNTFDKQNELEKAVAAYQKQVEVKPQHEWAWYNIGNIRYKQDRWDAAIIAFQKQVEVKPDHEDAWNYLGNALKKQDKLEEVIAANKQPVEAKPDHVDAQYASLAEIFLKQEKVEDAITAYQRQVEVKPDHDRAWYNIGEIRYEQEHWVEALVAFREYVKIKPDRESVWHRIESILEKQGKLEEVIDAYQKLTEGKPDHEWAWYRMGRVLQQQKKLDEAIAAYQKHVEIKPAHADAWNYLGIALWKQDKIDKAAFAFAKALAVEPDNPIFLHNDAKLALVQNDIRRCQTRIDTAIPLVKSDNPLSVILSFYKWLADPEQGWENVITAIVQLGQGVDLQFNSSNFTPVIERQDKETQYTIQQFITFFGGAIDLPTLKKRLTEFSR